jgi:hypothetical protein
MRLAERFEGDMRLAATAPCFALRKPADVSFGRCHQDRNEGD